MSGVVVLGGYGRLGRQSARAILAHAARRLVVAGRNVQRAEAVALGFAERAAHIYADAADPRTLERTLEGADALVICCGGATTAAIQRAIEMRVAVLSPAPVPAGARDHLSKLAWDAQVPVVECAGAVPGIPGLLAELLVRQLPAIGELWVNTTGPWRGSATASDDVARWRAAHPIAEPVWRRLRPRLESFPAPTGACAVHLARCPDLAGFAQAHCVEHLTYCEAVAGPRWAHWGSGASRGFAAVAQARAGRQRVQVQVVGRDALHAAAAMLSALLAGVIAGEVPAGLSTPREALSPASLLIALEKQGLQVHGPDPAMRSRARA